MSTCMGLENFQQQSGFLAHPVRKSFWLMLQLLIRVKSAGVNPVDTYIRSGNHPLTPPLPYTPGNDGAGVVEDVGKEVTKFKV